MNGYFDSHAHYDDARFDADRDALLRDLPKHNIGFVINAGCDMASSQAAIGLAEAYPYIYAAVGVHPHEAVSFTDADIDTLRTFCAHAKVVAVGEMGLDYHYDFSPRELQRACFHKQLMLSLAVDRPVIIHAREAAADTMAIIKQVPGARGVMHCYAGSVEMALDYVAMGFYIGIGGAITFDKSRRPVAVAEQVPLDCLLIETDAPYMTPKPNRGRRNDSTQLRYIVEAIAQAKHMTPEAITEATCQNAKRLFAI